MTQPLTELPGLDADVTCMIGDPAARWRLTAWCVCGGPVLEHNDGTPLRHFLLCDTHATHVRTDMLGIYTSGQKARCYTCKGDVPRSQLRWSRL